MKNLIKNKAYLTVLIGIILSVLSVISILIIKNKAFYTTIFALNILLSFFIISFILLTNYINKPTMKFKYASLYLFTTLALLLADTIIMSYTLDLSIYTNLMYLSNIQLYLVIYSVFVLLITLISIYALLKDRKKN